MAEQKNKKPLFRDAELIGYCSTVVLSMDNDGLDTRYKYVIEDFEEAEELEAAQEVREC